MANARAGRTQDELKEMVPKLGDRKVLMECLGPIGNTAEAAKVAGQIEEQRKTVTKFKEMPVRLQRALPTHTHAHGRRACARRAHRAACVVAAAQEPSCCKWANADKAPHGGVCGGLGFCWCCYCWSCYLWSELPWPCCEFLFGSLECVPRAAVLEDCAAACAVRH